MAPKPATRRVVTNENDENAATTRVTRAKAAALETTDIPAVKKGLVRTKSTTTANARPATKRAALGDVSNYVKTDLNANGKDGKKKLASKPGALTKAAQPTKVEKSRPQTTKVLSTKKTTIQKSDLKRPGSGSGGSGHISKRVKSTTKLVVEADENVKPEEDEEIDDYETRPVDEAEASVQEPVEFVFPENVDDLDREDLDDPLMVAEYVHEIFDYYKELELQTMANPNYMENQGELEWQMRGILVDWLLEVHTRFRLLPETLFLAVNIIDRFLSSKVCQLDRLQLVGVTAMFIASKYEEVLSPHVSNFRHVADDGFTDDEILSAERFVLGALNYDMSYPNPMNFLRRISKADNYDVQTRTLGKYLLEISCLDHRFIGHPPSRIAAAAMYLAREVLDRGEWDHTIAFYASCTEEELMPCYHLMLDYLSGPVKHDAFFKKYAHKKFMKASMVVRQWVKANGPEIFACLPEDHAFYAPLKEASR